MALSCVLAVSLAGCLVLAVSGVSGTYPLCPAGGDVVDALLVLLTRAEGVGLSHSGWGHHLSTERRRTLRTTGPTIRVSAVLGPGLTPGPPPGPPHPPLSPPTETKT